MVSSCASAMNSSYVAGGLGTRSVLIDQRRTLDEHRQAEEAAVVGVRQARLFAEVGQVTGGRIRRHVGEDAAFGQARELVVRDADEQVAGFTLRCGQERLLLELAQVELDDVHGDAERGRERVGLALQPLERLVAEGGPDREPLPEREPERGDDRDE